MSLKLHKRLSSKKKKVPKCSAQTDLLCSLGLETFRTSPLGLASMLQIGTWALENPHPVKLSDLPNAFLHRLWLLSPDARSSSISSPSAYVGKGSKSTDALVNGKEDNECALNPLDLVTAVFMSSDSFLQQEIVSRMFRCHFAVPIVLPNVDQEENGCFLLWPLRSVYTQWRHFCPNQNAYIPHEGNLTDTPMPLVSFIRIGHSNVSKSQTLNHLMLCEAFLHKGSAGGQQPHRLANGMVEIAWYLPSGDASTDMFPVPIVFANLRGDACGQEKNLKLLCQASSAIVIFCGTLQEKEKQLVSFCTKAAKKVVIVYTSDSATPENSTAGFFDQLKSENILDEGDVLQATDATVTDLANSLDSKLKVMLTEQMTYVTLLAAAELALKMDLNVDEGPACRKALALTEQVLEDLHKGSTQYQEKQLPIQGHLWRKLTEIEKEEKKHKAMNKDISLDCHNEKKEILKQLHHYKMTPAMKVFIDALFTNNKVERTYFLSWMKLKLTQIQNKIQNVPGDVCNCLININALSDQPTESENRMCKKKDDSDSFGTTSSFEVERTDESAEQKNPQQCAQGDLEDYKVKEQLSPKPELFVLGLQHFLREIGLIYQITHTKPSKMSHNVLQLPSLATELLLYGVPLEIMDGDVSNIPMQWLTSVFIELQRRLPKEQLRTKVLTTIGAHSGRNTELLSAIFNVNFSEERQRCTRGIYMLALNVPTNLQNHFNCDFLLLLNVEGLCSGNQELDFHVHDDEMATVAAGLSDILIVNISSQSRSKFDRIFAVLVNSFLRVSECGTMPICQIVSHNDNINTILQARQLDRVCHILQAKSEVKKTPRTVTTTVIEPWHNSTMSEAVDQQYRNAVTTLKRHIFDAIKKSSDISETPILPLFMGRLCAIWDAVRANELSVRLQNTDIALSFSILCTELSHWENTLHEHMERWLIEAIKKIFATKTIALDAAAPNDLLNQLKNEAQAKVITEVDAVTQKLEAYWLKDQYLKIYSDTLKPVFTSNMDNLKERVAHMTIQRLMQAGEGHCVFSQIKTFETLLQKEQEIKLCELLEHSKASKILQTDQQLQEEFENVWSKTLRHVDFQPSEREDITPRVIAVLTQNLNSCELPKHIKNIEINALNPPESFQICDEYTVHHGRMKYTSEDHKKNLRQVASSIIDQYNQFVAEKTRLHSEFSESYITELLENTEKTLQDKGLDVHSEFAMDLKVYLCGVACKDFQKLHDSYTKDKTFLASINETKTASLAMFMYHFRKRDQGQRVAQAFTTQVIKSIVEDYIYAPLGMQVVTDIQSKYPQYQSPLAFYQSLLEELLSDDNYGNFVDFLVTYNTYRQRKIQEKVLAHISDSSYVNKWRQQRLGEIIGKIASAISQTGEAHNGMLSDVKSLLESFCFTLEKDIDIDITRTAMEGPLFDISTDWDRFVSSLMEELAAMRLELSQEFSQPLDTTSFLQKLTKSPQNYLFERLRGCKMSCPSCRAPCEANDSGHEAHRVSLHRPYSLLPPELAVEVEKKSISPELCEAIPCTDLDMKIFCETQSTMPTLYWRYVFAKFSEHVQSEVPKEWRKTTREDALNSLRDVFGSEQNM